MPTEDLTPWLDRVKKASSPSEVFSILDEFRKLEWTNEQCSVMGKLYIRLLERLGAGSGAQDKATTAGASEESGPVWYEKM